MEKKNISVKNILLFIIIVLLIIPQTRQQIQIVLNKGMAMISPSIENTGRSVQISSYDWELKDLNGNVFNLNNSKGRVVLINIWATWCPPCIAEMPSLNNLNNDYKDKIDIILVSNEDQKVIKTFLDKNNYNFEVFTPIKQAPKTFTVNSIPRTFLIDKKGDIIIDESGAANWNSSKVRQTIDNLLKV